MGNQLMPANQRIPPGWINRMSVGQWYRISGHRPDLGLPATVPGTRYLADNDPARDPTLNPAVGFHEYLRRCLGRAPHSPWHGRMGLCAITEAWNGAVFATGIGDSGAMVVFGGGHNDYFGSDVHAFDLQSRQWSRLTDGYTNGDPGAYGAGAVYADAEYPDGSPLPPHTYEYVQYDPIENDLILFKGQSELGPDVKAIAIPHMLHLPTRRWRRGPQHPVARLNSGGCTTWDEKRRVIWGHSGDADNGNAFLMFRPDGEHSDGTFGSWGTHYPNKLPGTADHNAMQIDPLRDIIVMPVHARNELVVIDPNRPDRPALSLHSASPHPLIKPFSAIEYAPNLDAFIYYSATDGAPIYSISAPDRSSFAKLSAGQWHWRNLLDQDNTLDPIADAQALSSYPVNHDHTFGRLRVASFGSTDLAILIRHIDSPVYALLLNPHAPIRR